MGGIFDPIHFGHLLLAEAAQTAFKFDKILFIPSFNPPHRTEKPVASFEDRCLMVRLAIEGSDRFGLSDMEKDLKSPGYTLAIVDHLRHIYPEAKLHLILGADNIAQFDHWHKPDELINRIKIVAGMRPGYEQDFRQSKWAEKVEIFAMPLIEISSTNIRNAIRNSISIRYLLPEEVRQFILSKGLYR
jgi:nicotinate-nucleotide adenylyltransferase